MPTTKVTKKIVSVSASSKGKRHTGSMADQIDNLTVGSCVAVAERFPLDELMGGAGEITDSLKKLRSAQSAYVSRITDELDSREFKVESGTYMTDDKTAIVVSVVITRIA